jgi:histidinol-phosphate/aromatic aminotransferase/cobyric acid decarboxylase-like protein
MAAARIRTLLDERERMRRRLEHCAAIRRVFPADANFLLVECRDAARVYAAGKGVGLIVRDFSSYPGLAHCLRISIGTPDQNRRLLDAVEAA